MADSTKFSFTVIFLVSFHAALGSDCPLRFPAAGGQIFELFDFSNCNPFYETFTHTIEICRDLCLRSAHNCKSFSFRCGDQRLSKNCRLFDASIQDLINMNLFQPDVCKVVSLPKNCVHESFLRSGLNETRSC